MTTDCPTSRVLHLQHAQPPQPQATTAIALIVAATSVGFAIHLHDGEYSPGALGLITLALIGGGIAVLAPPVRRGSRSAERAVTLALVAVLVLQVAALFMAWPGTDLPYAGDHPLLSFHIGLAVMAGWIALGLLTESRIARSIWFPGVLATFLLLGLWMIQRSPSPHIDVWMFQQQGSAQLLHGGNPYAMTYPDMYDSTAPGHQQVYGEGLSINGRLQFGFPYPPVSLLLSTIGYAVAGDCRYAQVVALLLGGLFLGYSGPRRVAKLAAALLLTTPRIFFILMRGWTEPFAVMLLAATVYCACRKSRWLPLALGLLLATKQYMILAVPLTFFLLEPGWRWRDWCSLLAKAAIVALVVSLPLALWDARAFWHSAVTVQQMAPFRWDALSYLVWYGFRGHLVTAPSTAMFWSSLAAAVTLVLSLWKAPRTPAGFAAALTFIFTAFFAFNKQAFCNYYFFVIGAACCAIAASLGCMQRRELPDAAFAVSHETGGDRRPRGRWSLNDAPDSAKINRSNDLVDWDLGRMLLQTNSYVVPKDRRSEHARLLRRFRQTLARLGCDNFEVYEQVGANWSSEQSSGRFVQIMRFRDRRHQLGVQAAERGDPAAQAVIAEFCDLINFPYQQQHGLFAIGFYTSILPVAPQRHGDVHEIQESVSPSELEAARAAAAVAAAAEVAPPDQQTYSLEPHPIGEPQSIEPQPREPHSFEPHAEAHRPEEDLAEARLSAEQSEPVELPPLEPLAHEADAVVPSTFENAASVDDLTQSEQRQSSAANAEGSFEEALEGLGAAAGGPADHPHSGNGELASEAESFGDADAAHALEPTNGIPGTAESDFDDLLKGELDPDRSAAEPGPAHEHRPPGTGGSGIGEVLDAGLLDGDDDLDVALPAELIDDPEELTRHAPDTHLPHGEHHEDPARNHRG